MMRFGVDSHEKRRRYREVASILGRHGLGVATTGAGMGRAVPFHRGLFGHPRREMPYTTAEHVRLALEDLGTTAIKLGQILSTRSDLVPADFVAELEKLRDQVPPVPTASIIEIVEQELCCSSEELFRDFDPRPLAAASIGQVHAATLSDGTPVVVKVRKPGVAEQVTTDLAIAGDLARLATRRQLLSPAYDLEALVDDFGWTLRAELDYVREGRNADRLREILAGDERVVIPTIHWRFTTPSVLVMDRIEGTRIGDVTALADANIDRAQVARTSAEILMAQVFRAGFFHADPHPGNFLVLSDGRIAMLDFGMVGRLDEELRHLFWQLLIATVRQDAAAVTDGLESLGILRSPATRDAVRRDMHHFLERYYGLSIEQYDISQYINDILSIVRRHQLQLPPDLALVLKTVAMSEGLWRQLDPTFNSASVIEPFVSNAAVEMYSPRAWGKRILRASSDTVELGAYLPGQLRRIASRLDRGEFEVTLRHRDIDESLNRLSSMVTRLSMAIVAASLIMGLPVLATVYEPPLWGLIAPVWFAGAALSVLALIGRLALAGRRPREH
jgi:ubiquinone biosynthesis protein